MAITSAEQAALLLSQQRQDKVGDVKASTADIIRPLGDDGFGINEVYAMLTTLIHHMQTLGPKWMALMKIAQKTAFNELVAAQELSQTANKPNSLSPALGDVKGHLESIKQQLEAVEAQTRMGYLQVDCDSTKINRKHDYD